MTSEECQTKIVELLTTVPGLAGKTGGCYDDGSPTKMALKPKSWKQYLRCVVNDNDEYQNKVNGYDLSDDDHVGYDGMVRFGQVIYPCTVRCFALARTDIVEAIVVTDVADEKFQLIFFHCD